MVNELKNVKEKSLQQLCNNHTIRKRLNEQDSSPANSYAQSINVLVGKKKKRVPSDTEIKTLKRAQVLVFTKLLSVHMTQILYMTRDLDYISVYIAITQHHM